MHVLIAGAQCRRRGAGRREDCRRRQGAACRWPDSLAEQLAENVAAQVLAIAKDYSHLLFPATAHGKNVAPRVAALLDVAQISDATKIVSADTVRAPDLRRQRDRDRCRAAIRSR